MVPRELEGASKLLADRTCYYETRIIRGWLELIKESIRERQIR